MAWRNEVIKNPSLTVRVSKKGKETAAKEVTGGVDRKRIRYSRRHRFCNGSMGLHFPWSDRKVVHRISQSPLGSGTWIRTRLPWGPVSATSTCPTVTAPLLKTFSFLLERSSQLLPWRQGSVESGNGTEEKRREDFTTRAFATRRSITSS